MIPDSLKQRYETQVRPRFERASGAFRGEFTKVMKDLGVSVNEERSLKDVIAQIRSKNPTFRELGLNLDMATYDLRKKLWWDANMFTAYAYDKAEQAYDSEVAPRFSQVKARAQTEARKWVAQLRELTGGNAVASDTEDAR